MGTLAIFGCVKESMNQTTSDSLKVGHINFWFSSEPDEAAKNSFAMFMQQKAQFLDRKDIMHNVHSLSHLFGKDVDQTLKFMFVIATMMKPHFSIIEQYGMSVLKCDGNVQGIREKLIYYRGHQPSVTIETTVKVDIGQENRPSFVHNTPASTAIDENITKELSDSGSKIEAKPKKAAAPKKSAPKKEK